MDERLKLITLFSSVSKSATVSYLRFTSFLAAMFVTVTNDMNEIETDCGVLTATIWPPFPKARVS